MELHNEFRIIAMQKMIENLPPELVLEAFRKSAWQFYFQEASFMCLIGGECSLEPKDYADAMSEESVKAIRCFPIESIRKKAIDCVFKTETNRKILQQKLAKSWGIPYEA